MNAGAKIALASLAALGVILIARKARAASLDVPPQPIGGSVGILQTVGKHWILTARMADLVYQNASKVIPPFPLPAGPQMSSTAYMLTESDKISAAAAG